MAPSHSSGLSKVFLAVSRFRSSALKPAVPRLQELVLGTRPFSPWQCLLHRGLAASRSGGEDEGGGGKPFKDRAGSFADSSRGSTGNDEFRLFGEGGLFGRPASSEEGREADDLDEHEDDAWAGPFQDQQRFEFVEEEFEAQSWSEAGGAEPQVTVAEYTPGDEEEGGEGWTVDLPAEGLSGDAAAESLAAAKPSTEKGDLPYLEWMSPEEEGPSYIGKWGPDGRLIKGQPQTMVEGAGTSQDAAFGELIRKKGYTDDDIANLLAGFYEPVGLPHLDDYKFIDLDAARREKRRQMELDKIAEMAKRWVKKVDEQGFAHGVGRRKTSSARVWIKEGQGRIIINKKHHDMYFVSMDDRVKYLEPFVLTDTLGMFDTFVLVRGGGTTGQAGAIRLGVSRALMWYEPSLRHTLKKAGMLTRDPRMVERKKPGKAKARRSFQWVKR